jgi:hypothetical protein
VYLSKFIRVLSEVVDSRHVSRRLEAKGLINSFPYVQGVRCESG